MVGADAATAYEILTELSQTRLLPWNRRSMTPAERIVFLAAAIEAAEPGGQDWFVLVDNIYGRTQGGPSG
jgi:hypothetical protein